MQTDAISEVRKIEEAIEHLRTSQSLSGINRKRLVRACEILQEVFADLTSGADEKRRKEEVIHDQRSLMEGMKRYFFATAEDERNVAVEQDGVMRTLEGNFEWGQIGGESNALAHAILADCFQKGELTPKEEIGMYGAFRGNPATASRTEYGLDGRRVREWLRDVRRPACERSGSPCPCR